MINVALFGLGRIGQIHGENLHAHKRFKLKYTFDINKNLSRKISKKFNSISINNPKEAFQDKNIDIVFISHDGETAAILGNAFAEDLGFKNVSVFKGGILQWLKEGRKLVSHKKDN